MAIHEADAHIIEQGDVTASYADFFDGKLKPRPVQRKLKEGDIVKLNGDDYRIVHTPGHTPGSVCFYNEGKGILFSGDVIFSDGVGRTDMPGGDDEALASSMEKISRLKVNKLFPGHGDPVKEGADKLIHEMLEFTEEGK